MIKGLTITPPVLGRISIGRVIEKDGKRLPAKDDQFTITSQVQNKDGWINHPLDAKLRANNDGKLRQIPVRMLFNDPELNLRAEYTLFDRQTGRPLCVGDGEQCQRRTNNGVEQLPCPSPDRCPLAQGGACKPYGRLYVNLSEDDELGTFIFRTTGFNSIRTLRDDVTLKQAVQDPQAIDKELSEHGFDQAALEEAAKQGYVNSCFEIDSDGLMDVAEEFYPVETDEANSSPQGESKNSVAPYNVGNIERSLRESVTAIS